MNRIPHLLAVSCLLFASSDITAMPKEAKTTKEILTAMDLEKGFGIPTSEEFTFDKTRHFVVWNNPFSGRAAVFCYTYRYDAKAKKWVSRDTTLFEGTPQLKVSLDKKKRQLVYTDAVGKARLTLPVTPKKK